MEKGEQAVITKHGYPVAKIVPAGTSNRDELKNAISAIKEFRKHHRLGKLNWKDLRDEERRY